MTHSNQLLKRKKLVLAMTSALAVMAPMIAKATPGCSTIDTGVTSEANWSAGGCTITSTGSVIVTAGTAVLVTGTSVGTLTNSGTISSGTGVGFNNLGLTVGQLNNANGGTISGRYQGIYNDGTIDTLTNSGYIHGTTGILNSGTVGTLSNSGIISGSQYGIAFAYPDPTGAVINSGTITGAVDAIFNQTPSLGPITNSGVIAGNIRNESSDDLTINGGTGTTFGTLTGYGGGNTIGTITNVSSNVDFGSGNLLLNDNINVTGHAVNNTGTAVLQVNQPISITGNYNQGAGATLQIGVASGATTLGAITDTGYGRLVVSGNSTIASGSNVTLQSNGYAFAAGQRYVVVDTAGTAVYNPGSLVYSASGFTGTIAGQDVTASNEHNDLVLTLSAAPTPTPALATVPNAVSSLGGLARYTGFSPTLLNLFDAADALNLGTTAAANRAGAQLSPVSQASSSQAAAAPTLDVLNVVAAHSDSLRLAQADGETGISTGDSPAEWGVWGQAFGGHASQGERDNVDGYNANYGGLLLGADRAINDNWRAGGVFTYSNTGVNSTGNTEGDTTTINGYGLIGYASYTSNAWYVNLSGGVVQQQYDTTRQVNFTGFSGTANGHFSGQQYVARAEGGYPLAVAGLTLTPLASLTYSYQDQGSYTESGGNGAALSVDGTHANSVKSGLGAKLEKSYSTGYGDIVPDLQVQWIHEFDHTAQATAASYAADTTGETAFTTVGATPVSDLADVSLGVTLLRANNLTLAVRYELQAASGFVSQTGTVRIRQLF